MIISLKEPMSTQRLPENRPPTHPGAMLRQEILEPLGVSQIEFAERIGVSYVRLNAVVNGRRGVTPNTALRLEQATGMDADFWLGLQMDWDLWQERHSPQADEIQRIEPLPNAAA
jgi:addiction module HigA family antidote